MYFHYHQRSGKNRRWCAEYYCSSTDVRKHLGCSSHYTTRDSLHEKVLATLRMQIEVALDYETVIQTYKDSRADKDIRLLMADEDTGKGKDESNSIVNQRNFIHRFLDNHAELSKSQRTEFVDM